MKARLIPAWVRGYHRDDLTGDLLAGLIVTMLVVPQGLAFAALAGLPAHFGLYASLLPLIAYALFGTSMVISVGPVAVISLMTAAALAPVAVAGSPEYVAAAALLALMSGAMLFLFGLLRLGVLAQFLSHPVISGFIAGSALLIIVGQLRPLLGIDVDGHNAIDLLVGILGSLDQTVPLSALLGGATLALLVAARFSLAPLLVRAGLSGRQADLAARLVPMAAVIFGAVLVALLGWEGRLRVIGELPRGLPALAIPETSLALIGQLWLPALAIGLVGFVESVGIARAYAARSGQRIDADAELRGLGAANLASGFSGAFPVTGALSRTALNAEAGARTPFAGVVSALLIALILLAGTGLFRTLPETVLAATIIVIAVGLIDLDTFRVTWRYDRTEAFALLFTAAGVLVSGVEVGIALGIAMSLATLIWRASRPHIAVLGRVGQTQHFRNVERHEVETSPRVLMLRVDENLFFGNAEAIEDRIDEELEGRSGVRHLVLVMSSVSYVDETALEMLERLNRRLGGRGIALHLAEVKGPVLDSLGGADRLVGDLGGTVYLSTWDAYERLRREEEAGTGPEPASVDPADHGSDPKGV
jgi:sulfate permease, SulP family